MTRKPDTGGARGFLAEIRSFVFTLVVVAIGIAFMAALFTGGFGGAQEMLGGLLNWFITLCDNVLNALRGLSSGAAR